MFARTIVVVSGIVVLTGLSGCRMCASPFDYTGPTELNAQCSQCGSQSGHSRARAGSAFAPADAVIEQTGAEEVIIEQSGDDVPLDMQAQGSVGTRVFSAQAPEIDFGVPPEHIISITDRRADEPAEPSPDAATVASKPDATDGWSARTVSRPVVR
ncbi:MAG: hypothetical protein D6741_00610 [Planctomycetota bacterium]|nr:MAG: hypothetical protein D6741_00610 [Planctomycetota bacterium]